MDKDFAAVGAGDDAAHDTVPAPDTGAAQNTGAAQSSGAEQPPGAEPPPQHPDAGHRHGRAWHAGERIRGMLPKGLMAAEDSDDAIDLPASRARDDDTPGPFEISFEPTALRRSVIIVLGLIAMFAVAWSVFGQISNFLFLILLSWLLAIAMEPAIQFFLRRGLSRGFGTGITLVGSLTLFVAFFVSFGGLLLTQLAGLVTSLPTLVGDVVEWLNRVLELELDPTRIADQLNLDTTTVASVAGELAGGIVGVLTSVFGLLFDFLTVIVFAFFIAADGPRLRRTIASWMPPRRQRVFLKVWEISLVKTGGFVASKGILAAIAAAAHMLLFWAIDLPYWLPLGLFAGLTSQFIPTIGTYIGVAVPMLFAVFDEPFDALWIAVFATIYQQLENYWLTPRVSQSTMDIHPAVALGSVFVGAAVLGPIGALIGIPLAAAIIAVVDAYGQRYELVSELEDTR